MTPKILIMAGSDSLGGAGIQADLKAVAACGGHALTVISALTAQNTRGVQGVWTSPLEFMEEQFNSVSADVSLDAIKTGMLPSPGHVQLTARLLKETTAPLVLDPVMAAESGGELAGPGVMETMIKHLFPRARLITPNLAEAAALIGQPVESPAQMEEAARALLALGPEAVLITGGHLPGDPQDLLFDGSQMRFFKAPRLDAPHTHGTGCSLASACAALIGQGLDLAPAVERARNLVRRGIQHGLDMGPGPGPVHLLYGIADYLNEETA